MDMTTRNAVKIVLDRRVRAGARELFEGWVKELLAQAGRFGGLEGTSVLRSRDEYFILLRFASHADLERWQGSRDVQAMLARAEPLATATDAVQMRTGLETWFTLPGREASAPPPKWKMALVTWLALLPQVIALAFLVPASVPFLPSVMISTAIPVAMLTWVVMPRVTRRIEGWLYA